MSGDGVRVEVDREGMRKAFVTYFVVIWTGHWWILAVRGGNPKIIGDSEMVEVDMSKMVFCFL